MLEWNLHSFRQHQPSRKRTSEGLMLTRGVEVPLKLPSWQVLLVVHHVLHDDDDITVMTI